MSPALRAGSAAAPSRLACCTANARAFAVQHLYGFEPLLLLLHGAGPITKKASIAGSSKFKLAEEEGFEPS